MFKRFSKGNFNKLLGHEAVADEIRHSHAYGAVAGRGRSLPRSRSTSSPRGQVGGYRDSMVGSISQYRDRMPVMPQKPEADKTEEPRTVIGNRRPQSGTADKDNTKDAEQQRRHHFIEPPKRNFNRFG